MTSTLRGYMSDTRKMLMEKLKKYCHCEIDEHSSFQCPHNQSDETKQTHESFALTKSDGAATYTPAGQHNGFFTRTVVDSYKYYINYNNKILIYAYNIILINLRVPIRALPKSLSDRNVNF